MESFAAPEPATAPQPQPESQPQPEALVPAAPKRSHRGLFIGVGIAALVLIVLLRPVAGLAQIPCELQVDELGIPKAPRTGPVGPPVVAAGARVEKGAVLARLTLAPDESPEVLEARIKALEA